MKTYKKIKNKLPFFTKASSYKHLPWCTSDTHHLQGHVP